MLTVPGLVNAYDFLTVQEKTNLVVFLLYSKENNIFHHNIWNISNKTGIMIVKDGLLNYIKHNTVDALIVRGIKTKSMSKFIKFVFENSTLTEVNTVSIPQEETNGIVFSMDRFCDSNFEKLNFEDGKITHKIY